MVEHVIPKEVELAARWAAIRRDYAQTEISWRRLALRYGLRSSAWIRRRAQDEGWTRDVKMITARLVTRAMAADGMTIEGVAEAAATGGAH